MGLVKENRKRSLTHREIALQIHELLDLPLVNAQEPSIGRKIIRIIIKAMRDALHRGEEVRVPGFGIFRIETYKGRLTGSNFVTPSTTSPVPLYHPDKKVVTFVPAASLSAMLNPSGTNRDERRSIESWHIADTE